ncbi:MAG: hypothetical protein KC478_03000 [Bacteriovoracaceae bacterium]|nr:hypothetical protein [Bacteriovoracaceae bacterium]
MKLVHLIIAMASLNMAYATNEIRNCAPDQESRIRSAIQESYISMNTIMDDIDHTIETRSRELPKHVVKKLAKAKYMLKCAEIRTDYLDFDCDAGISEGAFMQVQPIVGNEVKVDGNYLPYAGDKFLVGTIIHEATHKCGTNDANYFYQTRTKPRSNWYSGWHNTASTYDYWSIKGFCIPEIDC